MKQKLVDKWERWKWKEKVWEVYLEMDKVFCLFWNVPKHFTQENLTIFCWIDFLNSKWFCLFGFTRRDKFIRTFLPGFFGSNIAFESTEMLKLKLIFVYICTVMYDAKDFLRRNFWSSRKIGDFQEKSSNVFWVIRHSFHIEWKQQILVSCVDWTKLKKYHYRTLTFKYFH